MFSVIYFRKDGVLVPLLARPNPNGEGYELISGHRRKAACEWAGVTEVPVIIRDFDNCQAVIAMVDSNLQRENIKPSEKAFAYRMKLEAFGESLVMLILTALLSIIIIICGFFIIYTVYFRFLKILIIVSLGAIAFSTMGGNRTVSNTGVTYCKYFLSVVFEAVTMALAIIICNAFVTTEQRDSGLSHV